MHTAEFVRQGVCRTKDAGKLHNAPKVNYMFPVHSDSLSSQEPLTPSNTSYFIILHNIRSFSVCVQGTSSPHLIPHPLHFTERSFSPHTHSPPVSNPSLPLTPCFHPHLTSLPPCSLYPFPLVPFVLLDGFTTFKSSLHICL